MTLPENLIKLSLNCPFPLYVVGGYVRDSLAKLSSGKTDIDVCSPVAADLFIDRATQCGAEITAVYRNTGTVKLKFGNEAYEFACFRSDEYVRGVHTPVNTFFTDDILLDARRRDFKCNAVYYEIKSGKIVDPLGGVEDIENGRISTVADSDKVFGEDGLRLMRLARQAAQTGFVPTSECLDGAARNAALIKDVTEERIYCELDAILHADERYGIASAQYRGLKLLEETGVLAYILPELTLGKGMEQRKEFHRYDVLEHSLRTVKYAQPDIRLAALLHDVGKPYCMLNTGNFHGHEVESMRISREICLRFKVSKRLTEEVARLAGLHMYDVRCDARESKIRKLIVGNADIFDKLLKIKQADYSACRDDEGEAPCVTKWRGVYEKMLSEGAPVTLKQLNVRGNELIAAGMAPSSVGRVLNKLLEDCALDAKLNVKNTLIKRAVKLYGGDL